MLTLDFRLAVLGNIIINEFSLLNKNLISYFQDSKRESSSKFKHFSINWQLRRRQAHTYTCFISKKYKIQHNLSFDFIITKMISLFFIKKFRQKNIHRYTLRNTKENSKILYRRDWAREERATMKVNSYKKW